MTPGIPNRQIRASYTESTITVYQAYQTGTAEPAVEAGRFVAPFKLDRMTWIRPSFLWMAYRSGWGSKPGQERILAIEITRDGFEWALGNSCLSHYERGVHQSEAAWRASLAASPVRIQWDPERGLDLEPLHHRSLQIGLSGSAVSCYVNDWTVCIDDVTDIFSEVHTRASLNDDRAARDLLPTERPYPLDDSLRVHIGASTSP